MPLRPLFPQIFLRNRPRQIDIIDIRQRTQPRDHIREFLLQIRPVIPVERRRQFPNLLHQPEKRLSRPAFAVRFFVPVGDMFLKY